MFEQLFVAHMFVKQSFGVKYPLDHLSQTSVTPPDQNQSHDRIVLTPTPIPFIPGP